MGNPYRRLYNTDGNAVVREARTAADAADWTPNNLSAGEISGGVVAYDVCLDAREWSSVRLYPEFVGTPVGTPAVTVEPLIALDSASGRIWSAMSAVAMNAGKYQDVVVNGHFVAFRITILALNGTTSVSLHVTGGAKITR